MEIITGTGRRRSWPTAIREQIVSETLAAETTVTEVARRHDVDRSLVYRWRRQFGVVGRARESGMFLPVEVSDGGTATRTPQDTKAEMAVADPGLRDCLEWQPVRAGWSRIRCRCLVSCSRRSGPPMIPVPTGLRVWLATGQTDMRKGFPGPIAGAGGAAARSAERPSVLLSRPQGRSVEGDLA